MDYGEDGGVLPVTMIEVREMHRMSLDCTNDVKRYSTKSVHGDVVDVDSDHACIHAHEYEIYLIRNP